MKIITFHGGLGNQLFEYEYYFFKFRKLIDNLLFGI